MQNNKILNKMISALLALAMISQSGLFAYGEVKITDLAQQNNTALSAIDAVYERNLSADSYGERLNQKTQAEIKRILSSPAAKKIAELKKRGQNKYGNMWPMYVRSAGAKEVKELNGKLQGYVLGINTNLEVMPYKMYEKEYKEQVVKEVKAAGKEAGQTGKEWVEARTKEVLKQYPAGKAYEEYKKEAAEEILWNKENKAKIEGSGYKVIREYIKALNAEDLDSESISLLKDLKLNGKEVLSASEKKALSEYYIRYLNKQDMKMLNNEIFTDKSKERLAVYVLSEISDIMISGAMISGNSAEYGLAVQKIIYGSERSGVFGQILSIGFGALAASKQWSYAEGILSKYSKEEQEGPGLLEYLNLTTYSDKIQNRNGRYLGKVSARTQYATKYGYHNVFEDMAKVLGEDGSANALGLLYRYGSGRDLEKTIKPFALGALLSKRSGVKEEYGAKQALMLANMELGDISSIEEYDIDKALLKRYPQIRSKLSEKAIINEERIKTKETHREVQGYINRAAIAGDIAMAVWGAVGLYKLGVKGVGLARSTYAAVKSGQTSVKAIAKAAYINTGRNFARTGAVIKQYIRNIKINPEVIRQPALNLQPAAGASSEPRLLAFKMPFQTANTAKNFSVKDIKHIEQITDNIREHAVWKAYDENFKVIGYIKYTNQRELLRTKQIDPLIKMIKGKYDLFDVEYPKIISKNISGIAKNLEAEISKEMTYLKKIIPERFYDADVALMLSKVDVSGLSYANIASYEDIKLLNGKPINEEEWLQIVDFFRTLNENGFYYTDIPRNLHIRRMPNGKLKLTIIDFDFYPYSISDMHDLSEFELQLVALGLKERKFTAIYPENLTPPRLPR